MFIKNSINFSVVNTYDLNVNASENIWIEVTLHNHKKSVFGVIYRHPTYQISDFQENLEILLDKLNNNNMIYCICGDINVDLLKRDSQPIIQKYKDMLCSMECIPLINLPARIRNQTASLIDHIYTDNVNYDIQSYILVYDISNLLPIIAIISNIKAREVSHANFTKNTRNFVAENFLLDLESKIYDMYINTRKPQNSLDVNALFDKFLDIFSSTLDKHAPLKNAFCKQKKKRYSRSVGLPKQY